ncbi:MAG: hypothetical protein COA47_09290 [Robiginitomaculum sp.]|nr:MAG: hypothetical protein COA47_09290 [Robiginitomaculum sp.]
MSASPTSRALASLLALGIVLFCAWQLFTALDRVHQVRAQLASFDHPSRSLPAIANQQWTIPARSHGAAGAALQARLRASARIADVSLIRVEVRSADATTPQQVHASAQASGDISAIAGFIHQLESKSPALFIERIRIEQDEGANLKVDLVLLARTTTGAGS